jgi:hypothetical protein
MPQAHRCVYECENIRKNVLNLANLRALQVGTNLTIRHIDDFCKSGGLVSGGRYGDGGDRNPNPNYSVANFGFSSASSSRFNDGQTNAPPNTVNSFKTGGYVSGGYVSGGRMCGPTSSTNYFR